MLIYIIYSNIQSHLKFLHYKGIYHHFLTLKHSFIILQYTSLTEKFPFENSLIELLKKLFRKYLVLNEYIKVLK